jgi:O-succinylbenzoate synthase
MNIYRYILVSIFLLFSTSTSTAVDNLTQSTTTVAAIQLKTADVGNFSKIRELVKKAKAQGAELVIFPEDSVFG